jgi:PadR family transcriptional regulator PadR
MTINTRMPSTLPLPPLAKPLADPHVPSGGRLHLDEHPPEIGPRWSALPGARAVRVSCDESSLRYLVTRCTMHCMVVATDVLSQLRRGALEFCVLALLVDEERYGFELVRTLGATDGLVTGEGTLYPLLSRLKRDGLVASSWRDSDAGPPRKYYTISEAGRRALNEFTVEWRRFRQAVDALLDKGALHEQHNQSDRRSIPPQPGTGGAAAAP